MATFLCLSIAALLISPSLSSHSQTSTLRTYANKIDLQTLNATLLYTYSAASSSLSVAFLAPPAAPSGWVAWGINPSSPQMIGTQALLAYKKHHHHHAHVIRTFNLSSTKSAHPSAISFAVSNLTAEKFSDGRTAIFATLALPAGTTSVSHAWNVGSWVSREGVPGPHGFGEGNLESVGTLKLVGSDSGGVTVVSGGGCSTDGGEGDGDSGGDVWDLKVRSRGFWIVMVVVSVLAISLAIVVIRMFCCG